MRGSGKRIEYYQERIIGDDFKLKHIKFLSKNCCS